MQFLTFLWAGLRSMLCLTVVLGVAYPLTVLAVAQLTMPAQANGSMIEQDGRVVGSRLIGQPFKDDEWLWPRPSAADYDAMGSTGSNLGPNNPELLEQVEQRRAALAKANGVDPSRVPVDALTASSSGLDPHISPAYADIQVARIAKARGVSEEDVRAAIRAGTTRRALGVLGDPVVNVLEANLALQRR